MMKRIRLVTVLLLVTLLALAYSVNMRIRHNEWCSVRDSQVQLILTLRFFAEPGREESAIIGDAELLANLWGNVFSTEKGMEISLSEMNSILRDLRGILAGAPSLERQEKLFEIYTLLTNIAEDSEFVASYRNCFVPAPNEE